MARRCISVIYHLLWRRFLRIYREGRRPEGYIPRNLRTPAGGIAMIFTDWTWFIIMLYIMLNFDEVYRSSRFHSNIVYKLHTHPGSLY